MNRRQYSTRSQSSYSTTNSRRLLPRISSYIKTTDSKHHNNASTTSSTLRHERQVQQRQLQYDELTSKRLDELHNNSIVGPSNDNEEEYSDPPLEPLPFEEENKSDIIINASSEEDSIFSVDSNNAKLEGLGNSSSPQKRFIEQQVGATRPSFIVRKLREAALEKAMSAPGQRQRMVGGNGGSAALNGNQECSQGGGSVSSDGIKVHKETADNSSSQPPNKKQEKMPNNEGLSAFLSQSKANSTTLPKGQTRQSSDHQSGISSITMQTVYNSTVSMISSGVNLVVEQGQVGMSMPTCTLNERLDSPTTLNDTSNNQPINNESPNQGLNNETDNRTDSLLNIGSFNSDGNISNESSRESPEHSRTSPTNTSSITKEEMSPNSLSYNGSINSIDNHDQVVSNGMLYGEDESPTDVFSVGGIEKIVVVSTTSESPDNTPGMLCALPTLSDYSPPRNKKKLLMSKDGNGSLMLEGADSTEEVAVDKVEVKAEVIVKAEVDKGGRKEVVVKDEILVNDEDSQGDTAIEVQNTTRDVITTSNTELNGGGNTVLSQSAHARIERATTPRTSILEQRGWEQHHRYARHRLSLNDLVLQQQYQEETKMAVNTSKEDSIKDDELAELRLYKTQAEAQATYKSDELSKLRLVNEALQSERDGQRNEMSSLKTQVSKLSKDRERHKEELACKDTLVSQFEKQVKSIQLEANELKVTAEETANEHSKEIDLLTKSKDDMKLEYELRIDQLVKDMDNLKNELEVSRNESQRHLSISDENEALLHDKDVVVAELQSKLKALSQTKNDTTEEIEQKDSIITNLTEEVETLKNSMVDSVKLEDMLKTATEEKNRAESVVQEKQTMINELIQDKLRGDELQEQLESKLSCKSEDSTLIHLRNATIESLQCGIKAKNDENIKLYEKYAAVSKELTIAYEKIDMKQSELDELTVRLAEQDDIIVYKNNEIEELQGRLDVIDESFTTKEREQLVATLHAKEEECEELKSDIKRVSEDSSQLHAQLDDKLNASRVELTNLKKANSKALQQLEVAAAEKQSLLDDKATKTKLISQLKDTIRIKENEIDKTKTELYNSNQNITELRKEIKVASSELTLLKSRDEQVSVTTSQLTAEIENKAQQVFTLQRSYSSIAEEANAKVSKLEEDLARVTSEKDDLMKKLDAIGQVRGVVTEEGDVEVDLELQLVNAKCIKLEDELEQAKSEKDMITKTLEETIKDLKQELAAGRGLEESITRREHEREIEAMESKMASKSEEISTLLSSVEHLEQELIEAKASVNNSIMEERDDVKEKNTELEKALNEKEDELNQVKQDLQTATTNANKLKSEVDSLILCLEASHTENKEAEVRLVELQEQIKSLSGSADEKSQAILDLNDRIELNKKRLKIERDQKLEERASSSAAIAAKDKEIVSLRDKIETLTKNVRKIQAELDASKMLAEPMVEEISELKETMRKAVKLAKKKDTEITEMNDKISTLSTLCDEKQNMIAEKEAEIASIHKQCEELKQSIESLEKKLVDNTSKEADIEEKLALAGTEAVVGFEKQLQALTKEKELLQMDAASKHEVISDLILKNNQVLAEMTQLAQWKKEVLPKLEKVSKEEIASEVLAKRIVELESDLERSRRALAGLEEALMTVELERQKLSQACNGMSIALNLPYKQEMSSKEESTTWGYIRDV